MNQKGVISFLQILILIVGIVAVSYAIGSEVRLVGAGAETIEEVRQYVQENYGTPSGASVPIKPTHGYAGKLLNYFKVNTQPKWVDAPNNEVMLNKAAGYPSGWGYSVSGIMQAAFWAVAVAGIVKMVGGLFGLDDQITNAASTAIGAGVFAGQTALSLFGQGGALSQISIIQNTPWLNFLTTGAGAIGIGLAVAIITFVLTYKKVETKVIDFECTPWDAATGGSNCDKCNTQGLPCSEYQCRSLGQSCELINSGTTEEKCVWINSRDINYPIITPNPDALLEGYKYTPDNAISPPDRGVIIVNENSDEKCVKAFTPLTFGIMLDEPAKCKLDYTKTDSFDKMAFDFGGSLLRYNHTQVLVLPGPNNLASENITLKNGGEFELYARCQDANGNSNPANFVFKFCVEEGPDTTPPLIVTTNLLNNMPIAYNQSSVNAELYVNEPADCKWDHQDKSYDDMDGTMSCSSLITEMNTQLLYTCATTLTGLKNNADNNFYFRCKDKPLETQDRNVNTESYKFTLVGTKPLVIDSVEPNETIKDSTEVVQVTLKAETSAGYNEGEAVCYYSATGTEDYIAFYNTQSYKHSQDLWLPSGAYKYFIKCIDLGGNAEIEEVNFVVESDNTSPIIVRVYRDEPYLKLITNEEAECVYDVVDCNYQFEDGTSITTTDGENHFTDWNTKTNLYIKCKDEYGNDPQPSNTCSIKVRAFENE